VLVAGITKSEEISKMFPALKRKSLCPILITERAEAFALAIIVIVVMMVVMSVVVMVRVVLSNSNNNLG
jgi:hypothetical protein